MFSFTVEIRFGKRDFSGIVVHGNSKSAEMIFSLYHNTQKICGIPQLFLDSITHL